MGLAASQARLLTITARKADCEFQSMKLSHEKIALSRDMERISDEYQAAMGKTKLVYDYYGSGTSQMAMNYGILMTPSVYNDYYPKLLTDNKNRIVLSAPYATAAKAAGIPEEGFNGTPSSVIRNAFVESLLNLGVISAAQATTIESLSYNNAIGLGATFSATAATQEITFTDLKDMIKAYCIDTADYGIITTYDELDNIESTYPNEKYLSGSDDVGRFVLTCDQGLGGAGSILSYFGGGSNGVNSKVSSLSLYDLLFNDDGNHEYTLSMETGYGATIPVGEFAFMQQWLIGSENSNSFLNWMTDQFTAILGGVSENDMALQYAYNEVYDLLYPNEDIQEIAQLMANEGEKGYAKCVGKERGEMTEKITDGVYKSKYRDSFDQIATSIHSNNYDGNKSALVRRDADDYLGAVYDFCCSGSTSWLDGGDDRRECVAINLNNIAKVFLTAFQEYRTNSFKYSYNVGPKSNCVFYEPQDDDTFLIAANTDITDGSDNLIAGFYDALFNLICTSGWTENDNITDAEYMQELLKNGAVYISSMGNDGCYYQSSYSTDTYISEVSDTEGIAQAEAKYNAAKAKIENKENTIDVKMKSLDTEISSLTTEYDTMKNVISKTIEKSFKRYEA